MNITIIKSTYGYIGFIPFAIFVIIGSSNAVNLTDGLDGLATVPVILVAACFAFISYVTGNIVFSNYLQIPYIEGTGEDTKDDDYQKFRKILTLLVCISFLISSGYWINPYSSPYL